MNIKLDNIDISNIMIHLSTEPSVTDEIELSDDYKTGKYGFSWKGIGNISVEDGISSVHFYISNSEILFTTCIKNNSYYWPKEVKIGNATVQIIGAFVPISNDKLTRTGCMKYIGMYKNILTSFTQHIDSGEIISLSRYRFNIETANKIITMMKKHRLVKLPTNIKILNSKIKILTNISLYDRFEYMKNYYLSKLDISNRFRSGKLIVYDKLMSQIYSKE